MNFSEFCVPFCVARRGLFPRSSMNSSFTEACRPTANARSSVDNQGPSFFWPKFFLFVLLSMWKLRYTPLNLIPLLFRSLLFLFFIFQRLLVIARPVPYAFFRLLFSFYFFSLVSRSIDQYRKTNGARSLKLPIRYRFITYTTARKPQGNCYIACLFQNRGNWPIENRCKR